MRLQPIPNAAYLPNGLGCNLPELGMYAGSTLPVGLGSHQLDVRRVLSESELHQHAARSLGMSLPSYQLGAQHMPQLSSLPLVRRPALYESRPLLLFKQAASWERGLWQCESVQAVTKL